MPLRLYDNTRISAFRRCPRFYYYRHVRDWETKSTKPPLVFGSCWHAAQEIIWPMMVDGHDKHTIMAVAYEAFLAKWKEEGMTYPLDYEAEKELSPRTPGHAQEMIAAYVDERYDSVANGQIELISCEKAFIVPLDPDDDTLFYVGKIDKVIRQRGRYRAIEHKTTTSYKKDGPFRSVFVDSFSPNSQVDGYLYALHMTYPGEVSGVWVDAALVHKTETGFMFIPVERQMKHLDGWLWGTRYWIDQIEANLKHYQEEISPDDPYMAAFPQNTNSCSDFNVSCPYLDLCKMWPNPKGKSTPSGFVESKWDPLDHIDAANLLPTGEV